MLQNNLLKINPVGRFLSQKNLNKSCAYTNSDAMHIYEFLNKYILRMKESTMSSKHSN